MKHIKIGSPPRFAALLAGLALLGLVSQSAMAAGTLSGTAVNNLAKLSYSVSGTPQNEICSSPTGNSTGNGGTTGTTCTSGTNGATNTSFTVDNKVNLTVAEVGSTFTPVVAGQVGAVTTFTVTNNGNTAQGYNLAAANAAGNPTVFTVADNFNVSAVSLFVDSNTNGVYDVGVDTATAISSLAPNASRTVFVLATIPAIQVNGDQAVVTLTATTTTDGTATPVVETAGADTAAVDIVFADAANALTDPLAANTARDAIGIAQDAYRLVTATISVAKTATLLCDPFNGITNPKNIPGAMVQWTITVANTGAASATLATIADALDANTTHETSLAAPVDAVTCVDGAGTSGFSIASTSASPDARPLGGTAGVMTNAADADGATIAGQNATIDFTAALPGGTVGATTWTAGEVKAGETATVKFNVLIN